MLRLLGQVVPYHQAQVLVRQGQRIELAVSFGHPGDRGLDFSSIQSNSIYKMLLKHRQAIYLPDTSHVPAWQGMEVLGQPASWLGAPLLDGEGNFLGFLSLGRNADSPFILDEKQTCLAFAQRIAKTLLRKEKKSGLAMSDDFSMRLEIFGLVDTEGVY